MIVVLVSLTAIVGSIFFVMRRESLKMKKQWELNRAPLEHSVEMTGP